MTFFDCNLCFGPAIVPPMKQSETRDQLLDEMDFCGIDQGLVYHAAQRDDCPTVGNPLLLRELKGHSRLLPVWSILPPQTEELGTVDQFLAGMKKHQIRALRAFPTNHRFALNGTVFGELFEEMILRKIPLILQGEWDRIEALLREFPNLTVIANQPSNHGQDRSFRPLIEKYPNFYVDTTKYECDGGVASFVLKYGAERMVYGSGYPDVYMAGGMLLLLHAEISDTDRELIAGGNLTRLLEQVRL